jgi:hypothetical protein
MSLRIPPPWSRLEVSNIVDQLCNRGRNLSLAFPNREDSPALACQSGSVCVIAFDICRELCRPEFTATFGHPGTAATRVLMKKTTVHKDYGSPANEH